MRSSTGVRLETRSHRRVPTDDADRETPDEPGFLSELRRRGVFRVAAVHAVGAWLAVQVADATFDVLGVPPEIHRGVILLAIAGFPVAVALGWIFDRTEDGLAPLEGEARYAAVLEAMGLPSGPRGSAGSRSPTSIPVRGARSPPGVVFERRAATPTPRACGQARPGVSGRLRARTILVAYGSTILALTNSMKSMFWLPALAS